jgi:hypothetical protein
MIQKRMAYGLFLFSGSVLGMLLSVVFVVHGHASAWLNPGAAQDCPAPGSVERDGWTLDYEVTGTDGLQVTNADYLGRSIFSSAKLVEWHTDYGTSGYVLVTGCGGTGSGFPILNYGETQVLGLVDTQSQVIGFEVVQDFRMSSWGNNCNYRLDQRLQFFRDGRFRVVSGAYGKGCGTNGIYRPVVRLNIALSGENSDSILQWSGTEWNAQPVEGWWLQSDAMSPGTYQWLVSDPSGTAYFIAPGAGQFADGGRGDNAYLYVSQHQVSEGDSDLGVIGTCCNDDHQQGPEQFLNSQSIAAADLVLWYVPQMQTDASLEDGNGLYCWTLQGEPNPDTYPCFSGPLFIPAEQVYIPLAFR